MSIHISTWNTRRPWPCSTAHLVQIQQLMRREFPGIKLKGWDLKGPQTNLSYLVEFLQANDLCIISSMRARTPGKFVTFQDITHDPPPSSATLDTYFVLDHILCNISHQSYFQSIQSLTHIISGILPQKVNNKH